MAFVFPRRTHLAPLRVCRGRSPTLCRLRRPPCRGIVILGRGLPGGQSGGMLCESFTWPVHPPLTWPACALPCPSTTIRRRMTTNSSHQGLAALFASATIGSLLRTFVLQPQREFYQRELQRLTGAHLRQLQRDLGRLLESGFVERRSHGNRVYYRAVAAHPAFPALRSLIVSTLGTGDVLREALAGLGDAVSAALIYGSFARGDEAPDSDVDLLVVGAASRRSRRRRPGAGRPRAGPRDESRPVLRGGVRGSSAQRRPLPLGGPCRSSHLARR